MAKKKSMQTIETTPTTTNDVEVLSPVLSEPQKEQSHIQVQTKNEVAAKTVQAVSEIDALFNTIVAKYYDGNRELAFTAVHNHLRKRYEII
jgi:hypothetical protein